MARDLVLRQLGSRSLYLGDRWAADPNAYDDRDRTTFDHVLTLSHRHEPLTTHHHPLDDGETNAPAEFDAAVDTARGLYRRDGSLLIHCAAGISRSATVCATTIAAEEDLLFTDGLAIITRHRERACPHPALRDHARRYLREAEADGDDTSELSVTNPGHEQRSSLTETSTTDTETSRVRSLLDSLLQR